MEFTIVKVSGTTNQAEKFPVDNQGNSPVILTNLGGKMPVVSKSLESKELSSIHVLNGTIAENSGVEEGKTLLVQFKKTGTSEYSRQNSPVNGEQYSVTVVADLSSNPMGILDAASRVGEPVNYLIKETLVKAEELVNQRVNDRVIQ